MMPSPRRASARFALRIVAPPIGSGGSTTSSGSNQTLPLGSPGRRSPMLSHVTVVGDSPVLSPVRPMLRRSASRRATTNTFVTPKSVLMPPLPASGVATLPPLSGGRPRNGSASQPHDAPVAVAAAVWASPAGGPTHLRQRTMPALTLSAVPLSPLAASPTGASPRSTRSGESGTGSGSGSRSSTLNGKAPPTPTRTAMGSTLEISASKPKTRVRSSRRKLVRSVRFCSLCIELFMTRL